MSKLFSVNEFRLKLYPEDFYKVRKFYLEDLQFSIIREWDRSDTDKGVMFDVGGTILELLSPTGVHKPVSGADLSLGVPDVWGLHEELKDKGFVTRGLIDNAWGDTSFRVVDPEGFQISFFTKR
jgi:hypothetical protein